MIAVTLALLCLYVRSFIQRAEGCSQASEVSEADLLKRAF